MEPIPKTDNPAPSETANNERFRTRTNQTPARTARTTHVLLGALPLRSCDLSFERRDPTQLGGLLFGDQLGRGGLVGFHTCPCELFDFRVGVLDLLQLMFETDPFLDQRVGYFLFVRRVHNFREWAELWARAKKTQEQNRVEDQPGRDVSDLLNEDAQSVFISDLWMILTDDEGLGCSTLILRLPPPPPPPIDDENDGRPWVWPSSLLRPTDAFASATAAAFRNRAEFLRPRNGLGVGCWDGERESGECQFESQDRVSEVPMPF